MNEMKNAVLYIHGKGGSAGECEHYKGLFAQCDVRGLDYRGQTPWDAGEEIRAAVEELKQSYDGVILIANSIGAFYCLHAGIDTMIRRAYFISPIVDMERLIADRMVLEGVTESELRERGAIPCAAGEDLSWEYLRYVREHPVRWTAPTAVLCGSRDALTPPGSFRAFARRYDASLTVMEGGEHWFHTAEQMRFLDEWILSNEADPRELCLELRDTEWPFTGVDHDRLIVRAIVIDSEGMFRFVRAVRDDDFGKAELIETSGGGVEDGEDLRAAILRELKEELGAQAEILCRIGVVSDYYNLIRRHNINHYYLCRAASFGENHLTREEIEDFHLSSLRLSCEQAVAEYERCACTPVGRLIANRELPVLRRARELLDSGRCD